MKRWRGVDPEHWIEVLLIVVFAGMGLFILVLASVVLAPRVGGLLSGGITTPTEAAFSPGSAIPALATSTIPPTLTSTSFPTVAATDTPQATPTLSSSATPEQPTLTARPIDFSCDRPGWFPEKSGIREHAIFRYQGQTYLMAAQQPEQHAFLVARSSDLCHWQELPPILTKMQLDAWDGKSIRSPFVSEQAGVYYLFYTGVTWSDTERILLAVSTDPSSSASWQAQGEVFRPNHTGEKWNPGSAAACRSAMTLKDGDIYYLYYTGRDTNGGIVGGGISSTPNGPWEDWGAILPAVTGTDYESPFVVAQDGRYYLFYHLSDQGTQYRIGDTPLGPWSEPFDLAPGWAHEIWQEDGRWFTSFLTNYSVTIFPLRWKPIDGGRDQHLLLHPSIETPSPFLQDVPIWAHSGESTPHEVVLFRRTFTLEQALTQVEINLFADTRYEAWLDGEWLGRGPARFSYRLREYDVYKLDQLPAGEHTLAVLVQWAPNTRRSESIAPFLQGHLLGQDADRQTVIIRTNASWRAFRSHAWQEDGALVHSQGLIGPTELLDLSRLDPHWNQPNFNDPSWSTAVVINPSAVNYQPYKTLYLEDTVSAGDVPAMEEAQDDTGLDLLGAISGVIYRPRSIPALVDAPVPVTVLDAGLLSPDFLMGELSPTVKTPYTLKFTVLKDTYFTIEAPSVVGPVVSILLDNKAIGWTKLDQTRPDVYQARVRLFSGPHTLTFTQISRTGTTFSVSAENVTFKEFPFSQGVHAGRRMLLGAAVSAFGEFNITWDDQLSVEFPARPSYIVLDMGRTVYGRIQVDVSGPAGTVLDMGWDERLVPGTRRPLPFPGSAHKEWNQVDSWVLDGSRRSISTLDARAGRYIMIAVWGKQPVTLRDIRVYEERYPAELRGTFESSDPLLNLIWRVGADTLYPNMTDAYADPWRERGQWWGDAYVADHVNQVVFGDTGLLRRGLRLMADSYQPGYAPGLAPNSSTGNMTDYMMLWVHSLAEYVKLTGDTTILDETYPVLQKFMLQMTGYENVRTKLIDFPQKHWWLFDYVDTYASRSRYGQSTAINSMYSSTLLKAADLAEQAGDLGAANQWRQRAAQVRLALNELLFSPQQQRYLATYYQGYFESPNVHAQAWPLAYGVPLAENDDAVADALLAMLSQEPTRPNVGMYGFYWVLEGLGRSGRIEEALDLIRSYYGYMLERGATTWWERMDADQVWSQSLSHAWSGSPTWFLTTYVLGARAVGPNTWEMYPALTGIEKVSGTLPLASGALQASWKKTACGKAEINLAPGDGLEGHLFLPISDLLEVTVSDVLAWKNGKLFDSQVTVNGDFLAIPIHMASNVSVSQECR